MPKRAFPMNAEFRTYVAALRAKQGLPPTIQDPATLERVAAIFRVIPSPAEPLEVIHAKREVGRATTSGNALHRSSPPRKAS
jgi:hypothetical protein